MEGWTRRRSLSSTASRRTSTSTSRRASTSSRRRPSTLPPLPQQTEMESWLAQMSPSTDVATPVDPTPPTPDDDMKCSWHIGRTTTKVAPVEDGLKYMLVEVLYFTRVMIPDNACLSPQGARRESLSRFSTSCPLLTEDKPEVEGQFNVHLVFTNF